MADYKCPKSLGYLREHDQLVWVKIKAFQLTDQKAYARKVDGVSSVKKGSALDTFTFLAPDNIAESVSHTWAEMDSIIGDMSQKYASVEKAKEFINNAREQQGKQHSTAVEKAITTANTDVVKTKMDTALIYNDSTRREYTFEFMLVELSRAENSSTAIIEPIRRLEALSCPQQDGIYKINFPAVFEIETSPVPFIKIKNAALTSVQPTFNGPYRNGYPTSAQLQLTFTEIEPMYRNIFEESSSLITTERPGSKGVFSSDEGYRLGWRGK